MWPTSIPWLIVLMSANLLDGRVLKPTEKRLNENSIANEESNDIHSVHNLNEDTINKVHSETSLLKNRNDNGNKVVLASHPDCKDDIERLCSKTSLNNNFAVLDCLQNDKRQEDIDISIQCHHLIWSFKRNLTHDDRFEGVARSICKNLLDKLSECRPSMATKHSSGQILSCLIEHIDIADDAECRTFLTKIELIIFSDYRLIYKFTENCGQDINQFKCGRVDLNTMDDENENPSEPLHSQGQTIECLQQHTSELQPVCQHEILRIAELQSDDFHLDRGLYFACRDDRERFCSRVSAGDGRVYRCLMRHKLERDMSRGCRKMLFQREMLAVHDYKVSKGFAKACREDIRELKCRQSTSDKKEIRLAQILLCLENAVASGRFVVGECKAEMLQHRRSLFENYKLTPDLASNCANDILNFCGNRLEIGGKTLHCLMEHAKLKRKKDNRISAPCQRTLEDLLKEVNIGDDWRVDPVLQEACQTSVDTLCKDVQPGEGRILSCLMDHIDSSHMGDPCKESMLQIQYFVARDFDLDATLYRSCHEEAQRYCHAKKNWSEKQINMDPERGPTVISCLYRYAYHPKENVRLSRRCLFDIKRVMRQRAISVDLHPEIEESCFADLSKFCSDDSEEVIKKGYEMECLQANYEKITKECQLAVANYTEEEGEHLELNYPLYKACEVVLKDVCTDIMARDIDQGDLMECLIMNKNKPVVKRSPTCRVAIEHFQLLSLKDYRFNFKFKEACKTDVLKYCRKVKTKYDVVACLSTMVFNDTIVNRLKSRISTDCKTQLKYELLRRSENIKLDPELSKACESDRLAFCDGINPGEGQVIECLKSNMHQLRKMCRKELFKREQIEFRNNGVDYALQTVCKEAISKYCDASNPKEVIYCLRDHRNDIQMDPKCKSLVMKRLSEQNHDYRLNPRLKSSCDRDINKFCAEVVALSRPDEELDGRVVTCLKKQYVKNRLSQPCEIEVVSIMRETAENYELNPAMLKACSDEIKEKCIEDNDVQECLKIRFQNKEIASEDCKKEVATLIYQGKADIQSDPVLYKVCSVDIKLFCGDIPPGHGRQLSCLLATLGSSPHRMAEECKALLSKRVEMFEYAALVAPAESVGEVYSMMANSPARNYFLMVAFCIVAGIFFGGLFCGRVTKRVPINMKNK